jgi:hypothetical protein
MPSGYPNSISEEISRYGRTGEQVEEFYQLTRARLSLSVKLSLAPQTLVMLHCLTCNKFKAHTYLGIGKITRILKRDEWPSHWIDKRSVIEREQVGQLYECGTCKGQRMFGA